MTAPRPHPIALRLPKQTSMQPDAGLQAQLEARGDSLSAVIKRDVTRYIALLEIVLAPLPLYRALALYTELPQINPPYRIEWLAHETDGSEVQAYATLDALERASLLVGRTGCTIDAALCDVGLVAG